MKKYDERRLGMVSMLADDLMEFLLRSGLLPVELQGDDVRVIGGEFSPTGRLTLFIEGDTLPEEYRYCHQGIRSVTIDLSTTPEPIRQPGCGGRPKTSSSALVR